MTDLQRLDPNDVADLLKDVTPLAPHPVVHLTAEEIAAYVNGEYSEPQNQLTRAHLLFCNECTQRVVTLQRLRS